jgi:hypothetical protein
MGEDVVVVIVWYLDLNQPMQWAPITTKIVSSNSVHDKVYSIQHDVIKFVVIYSYSSLYSLVSSTNKNDHPYITDILLEATVNTITLPLFTDAYYAM